MTLQTSGDLSLEWRTVQQQTLSSIYSLNFNFKLDQNVKLTKKKKKKIEQLVNNQYFLTQLIELNNKLTYQINWLFEKAKQHDHTGQQVNGYYSMIRILLQLFRLISKKVTKLHGNGSFSREMIDLLSVVYYFVFLIEHMMLMFDYKNNDTVRPLNNDPNNLFSYSIENFITLNLLPLHEDAQRALSVMFGRDWGVFWYSKSMQNVFKAFRLLLIGCTSNPFRFLHCLFSTKECGRNLARKCSNSTVEYVSRSLSALEYRAYNRTYFSLIHLNKAFRYNAKTVHVKVSTTHQVPLNNAKSDRNNGPSNQHIQLVDEENQRKVRCRLISGFTKSFVKKYCAENGAKDADPQALINPNRYVIFSCHGGGFTINSPDSHEIYLRKWATKLNGIPILSVDYQLKSAYPQAIQDVLDVYLKLFTVKTTNSTKRTDNRFKQSDEINQAEKLFGFVPKNVLLVGDSCGGNLQLSLLCCLNDIRRREASRSFIMPFAFTAIYPVFDLRLVCSPSKFIGALDPILTNGNLMAMHGTYGGLSPGAEHCNSIVNRIKNRHVKPWFLCTDEQCTTPTDSLKAAPKNKNKTANKTCPNKHVESRFVQMDDHLDGPFASPATYKHIADLREITIDLVVSNICPLLDESVEMYRVWPGPKAMHVFNDLPHGFIQFIDLSPSCKKASKQIVQIINATIAKHDLALSQPPSENNNDASVTNKETDAKRTPDGKSGKFVDAKEESDTISRERINNKKNLKVSHALNCEERL